MPPVSKTQGLSGAERAERTRHFYRLSTPAVGWQLLYVGNAVANLADVDWIPVMGPAPAPRTAPPASKVLLTVDSLQIGRSTKLSAETASQVLSWLLDLSSLRLKSSIRTQPSNWICDTAPHVAMWIHGHAGDAKSLAAVCTAWRNVVQLYRSRWPQDFRRLLQLDVGHGWPVASVREALQVLARASWQNMLHLTDFPAFRDNAWPAHVTSVALKMPVKTQLDNYLDFSVLRMLRVPFAAFAWKLLHDVPLPWVKMMASRPAVREGMTSSRAASADSESKTLTADLLCENNLRGSQHLSSRVGLAVTPGGFVTASGCTVRSRVGAAMRDLAKAVPGLCLVGWSQGWSSSFRDGSQLCFFCERMESGEERCPQCKDARSWSTLSATLNMSFSAEVHGEAVQVEFAIEARALPFVSISSDDQFLAELAKIIPQTDTLEEAFATDGAETLSELEEEDEEAVEMDIFGNGN